MNINSNLKTKFKKTAGKLLIAVIFLINFSCSATQKELRQSIIIDQNSFQNRNFKDIDLQAFITKATGKEIGKEWDLNQLYLAAIYFNPRMDSVKSQLQLAQAAQITAGQIPNPTLNFLPGIYTTTDPKSSFTTSTITIPIETNGKRALRKNISKYQTSAAEAKIEVMKWTIRKEILTNLIDLYAANQKEKIYRNIIRTQKTINDIYESRSRKGQLLTPSEQHSNVAYIQDRLQLKNIESTRETILANLAVAISVPISAIKGIVINFDDIKNFDKNYINLTNDENLRKKLLLSNAALVSALMCKTSHLI